MKRETAEIFSILMKYWVLDRKEYPELWVALEDDVVSGELEVLSESFKVSLTQTIERLYMEPMRDNDIVQKSNVDFRLDVQADNDTRARDLNLMAYLLAFIFSIFYPSGSKRPAREALMKEDLVAAFTQHCEALLGRKDGSLGACKGVAELWMSKMDGDVTSRKSECRYGVVNRLLGMARKEDYLVVGDDGMIRLHRRAKDLFPVYMSKPEIEKFREKFKEDINNAKA